MVEVDSEHMSDHADILSAIQSSKDGGVAMGNSKKLLEELSAALDDNDDDGRGYRTTILSKEQLFSGLEQRYLTPSTQMDKTLLAASQM